ncbi:MAG: site-specific DNA-methyltransferase [Synechococcus sp. SB0678_bin_12]|nr:site-specific DNA-methyltransferase [Synechococcus sp. SB0678_bin_12]MYI88154.1 site-specific DNA-methyltransferase [Synechococcus sp. SB0672_bin_10]
MGNWPSTPKSEGIVVDLFMGSRSTIAAAEAVGYRSIDIERYSDYYTLAEFWTRGPGQVAFSSPSIFRQASPNPKPGQGHSPLASLSTTRVSKVTIICAEANSAGSDWIGANRKMPEE